MRTLRSIAAVLVSAAFAGACLDQSPLPYEGPEGGGSDGSVPDVLVDVNTADGPDPACMRCLKAACASSLAACEQNTKCAKFVVCMDATRCWGASLTDLANIPPCLLNCGLVAGITGQADPSTMGIGAVILCAQDPMACASPCVGGAEQ